MLKKDWMINTMKRVGFLFALGAVAFLIAIVFQCLCYWHMLPMHTIVSGSITRKEVVGSNYFFTIINFLMILPLLVYWVKTPSKMPVRTLLGLYIILSLFHYAIPEWMIMRLSSIEMIGLYKSSMLIIEWVYAFYSIFFLYYIMKYVSCNYGVFWLLLLSMFAKLTPIYISIFDVFHEDCDKQFAFFVIGILVKMVYFFLYCGLAIFFGGIKMPNFKNQ